MHDPAARTCPPHFWRINRTVIDDEPHDHHVCATCGAQKDLAARPSASLFLDKPAWLAAEETPETPLSQPTG